MEKKRLLIVTQELEPYLSLSDIANTVKQLPQYFQDNGMEIRVLMPRFGNINERRHRLHEVVRLSGINIIIDEDDYPLIIKVASLPGARLQVYFLDNDDLFGRKAVFYDDKKKFFQDNAERTIFFCKGVLEIVKKFGWPPDIIHCHGWMTSLIPLYVKTVYAKEPVFTNSKVLYSVYENGFGESLGEKFIQKAPINDTIDETALALYKAADSNALNTGAINFADAVIRGSDKLSNEVDKLLGKNGKLVLDYQAEEGITESYLDFYKKVLAS